MAVEYAASVDDHQRNAVSQDFDAQLVSKLNDLRKFVLEHHDSAVASLPLTKFSSIMHDEMRSNASHANENTFLTSSSIRSSVSLDATILGSVGSGMKSKRAQPQLSMPAGSVSSLSKSLSVSGSSFGGCRMKMLWGSVRETEQEQLLALYSAHDGELHFEDALRMHSLDLQARQSQIGSTVGFDHLAMSGRTVHRRGWYTPFMLDPASSTRVVWALLSLLLLAYDFFMVPVEVGISNDDSTANEIVKLAARSFWTCDIIVTCFTGIYMESVLIMDLRLVTWEYAKSWLLFDVSLVILEWVLTIASLSSSSSFNRGSVFSLSRSARSSRVLKLLRLFRLARVVKIRPLLKQVIEVTSEGLQVSITLLTILLSVITTLHFGACIWVAVGKNDGGWVRASLMRDESNWHVYAAALQWMLLSFHGSRIPLANVQQTQEIFLDDAILLLNFAFVCWIIASVTWVKLTWSSSDTMRLHKMAKRYLKAHDVSKSLKKKTHHFLHSHGLDGPGALVRYKTEFFKALPPHLQEDLHYETRAPALCRITGFLTLHSLVPRCVRHMCDRIHDKVAIQEETVFSKGNVCQQMYIIRSGVLTYKCEESRLSVSPRYYQFPRDHPAVPHCDILGRGQPLGEASLWTDWEHTGHLEAVKHDALLLLLDSSEFGHVCSQYRTALIFGFRYAYHFVGKLNRCVSCDLTGFDLDFNEIVKGTYASRTEDHFAFLSHYKIEAGTEAILMRDLLLKAITSDVTHEACDLKCPVFVDTENLEDLDQVVAHVQCSSNLVVLFTPGFLSRPWCLLELVTAVRSGIHVVPVEIQRPGMECKYPDDAWYSSLSKGKVISKEGTQLLSSNGISLDEVEDAIRTVLKQITLPFSPHKSETIRFAEIEDILTRCSRWNQRLEQSGECRLGSKASSYRLSSPSNRLSSNQPSGIMKAPLWQSEISI